MKYKYQCLPNFIINKDGTWRIINFSRVLVPIIETKEDVLFLEE